MKKRNKETEHPDVIAKEKKKSLFKHSVPSRQFTLSFSRSDLKQWQQQHSHSEDGWTTCDHIVICPHPVPCIVAVADLIWLMQPKANLILIWNLCQWAAKFRQKVTKDAQ